MQQQRPVLFCGIHKPFAITSMVFFVLMGIFLWFFSKGDSFILLRGDLSPFKNFIFRYGTWLGDGVVAVALMLGFAIFKRWHAASQIAGSYLLSGIVAQSFKNFVESPRPARFFETLYQQIEAVDGVDLYMGYTSFPSGHTTTAFAIAVSLLLISPWWRRYWWLAFLLAVFVGYSRVYLGQHFPVDVYFGALIGIASAHAVCPWINDWKWLNRKTQKG